MYIMSFEKFLKEKNSILIDVRTPSEFRKEKIPNSVNIPVLLDEERVIVGTTYVRESKEKAKELGVKFISKRLPEVFLQVQELASKYDKLVFMCARGGMRSRSMTSLFESLGYKVAKLEDGYKGYRAFVQKSIEEINKGFKYIVVHGRTGVGKTKILNIMKDMGISVMDLEKMAAHKGSFFGALGEELPQSQKRFDGEIFEFLRNCKSEYIIVESESKRIGDLYIPEAVYKSMVEGKHLFIDTTLENRVDILMEDYSKVEIEDIKDCILKVARYVSKEKSAKYIQMAEDKDFRKLAKILIEEYYDPLYEVSIEKHNFEMEIFYTDRVECAKKIAQFVNEVESLK